MNNAELPGDAGEDEGEWSGHWRIRGDDAIPGGSSTGSKRAAALYGSEAHDSRLPTHYERANGCSLFTTDGIRLIDCGMALGAVAIGYADPATTRAVQDAAANGNVSLLPHRLEVEVAERLIDVIPCAEQVRFLRTGAEANAAAIRTARTYTSRTHIIACGYFGWLDWCSDAAGVPASMQEHISWVAFNDVAAITSAFARLGNSVAAVIIEPLVELLATPEWLQAARDLTSRTGAVLIFDEVKTAFRMATGGVQGMLGIEPDLTTLGKAMANGYPLAAMVGRAELMQAASVTWISSTAAAESTGLAAANAVLDWHDRMDVCGRLAEIGGQMQQTMRKALASVPDVKIQVAGQSQMFRLVAEIPADLDALVAYATRHGVLLKRGAYQFAALAHNDEALRLIGNGIAAAARDIVA